MAPSTLELSFQGDNAEVNGSMCDYLLAAEDALEDASRAYTTFSDAPNKV